MSAGQVNFKARQSIKQVEEGNDLAPKFDDRGLIAVVTTDADSGELLMQGYMNAESLRLTIQTREAHYYSRSREALWHKGATSGFVQEVRELLVDGVQHDSALSGREEASMVLGIGRIFNGIGQLNQTFSRQKPNLVFDGSSSHSTV